MNALREKSVSLWRARHELDGGADIDVLTENARADVVVVGGGIAGLSTAYELARLGQSVLLVDRGRLLGGMTSRTTAHLASAVDDYYHVFIRQHGREAARLFHASQKEAIDHVQSVAGQEKIDCNFARLDGVWFAADAEGADLLERERQACQELGIPATAGNAGLSFAHAGATLTFPDQGRFDPVAYCRGLIAALRRMNARLCENSIAQKVEEDESGVKVTMLDGAVVEAKYAVFATNSPVNDTVAIHTKQAPYRTYVVAGRVAKGSVTDLLMWDTADPYHYVRLEPDQDFDWLVVGGEDHKTGTENDAASRFAALERGARERWPQLGEIEHRWSGQVMEPADDAPYLGRNPGNNRIFVITGDSGQGMTNGVAGSLLIRDLIAGGKSVYADLFDPARKPLGAALEYLKENLTAIESMARRVVGASRSDPASLGNGEGALLRMAGRNVAAWRAADGALSLRSAVCTHVGCLVQWNGFEQCWDCPCHDSHFAATGEALNAPAIQPLSAAEREE